MKLLVLLPDAPTPWSNTAARYWGPVLRTLDRLGHEVQALAVRRGAHTDAEAAEYFDGTRVSLTLFDPPLARRFLERKVRSLWRSGWELSASDFGRAARRLVERAGHDAVLAEMPSTGYGLERHRHVLISIHHFQYVDLRPWREPPSLRSAIERLQARRQELSVCRRAKRLRTTSARLEGLARDAGVRAPVTVVPICVDPALYEPVDPPPTPTVGVLGSMFWPPSRRAAIHFLEALAPRLRRSVPGVRFVVGGWRAREFLGPYAAAADVELLDSFADSRDAFARLGVLVYAPPIGTGMKVKVLEAMAYGVPAVVNDEGFEGLEVDPEPAVARTKSDEEIVALVTQLLRDDGLHRRTAAAGRECIMRSFSPAVVAPALANVLGEAARPRSS